MSGIAAAIAGGAALTAGAGYLSAKSAQSAAKNNQANDQLQQYAGMARAALAMYGPDKGRQWIKANIPSNMQAQLFGTPASTKQVTSAPAVTGASQSRVGITRMFGTGTGATNTGSQTVPVPATNGLYNLDDMAAASGPGYLSKISDLGEAQIARDRGSANAMEGLVQQSRGYGNAMQAQIERDANQQQARQMAASDARARATGTYGSSLNSARNASLAANIFQAKQNALTNLNMGVQDRTMGLQQNVIGQNLTNSANATNLRMAPINTEMGMLGSGVFNPFVQSSLPGVSPIGTAANSLGNTLSGYGGYQLGQQNAMRLAASMYGQGLPTSTLTQGGMSPGGSVGAAQGTYAGYAPPYYSGGSIFPTSSGGGG